MNARKIINDGFSLCDRLGNAAADLLSLSNRSVKENERRAVIGYGGCAVATFVLGFMVMSVPYRSVTGSVREIIHEADGIAAGKSDFTTVVKIPSSGVFFGLARSIKNLSVSLRGKSKEIKQAAKEIAGAADSLSAAVNLIFS